MKRKAIITFLAIFAVLVAALPAAAATDVAQANTRAGGFAVVTWS